MPHLISGESMKLVIDGQPIVKLVKMSVRTVQILLVILASPMPKIFPGSIPNAGAALFSEGLRI